MAIQVEYPVELGGMTEAGFNRVVAMIQPWMFTTSRAAVKRYWCWCERYDGRHFGCCPEHKRAHKAFAEWRASLPKTRNKKQRKRDREIAVRQHIKAKYFAGRRVNCASGCGTVVVLDYASGPDASRVCVACSSTPLQRLMRFADEDELELAELARLKAKFEGGG